MKDAQIAKRLGSALRQRRAALGISQAEIARKLQMHRTHYGGIERGEHNVHLHTLERICRMLRASVWEVMREAEEPSAAPLRSKRRAPRRSA